MKKYVRSLLTIVICTVLIIMPLVPSYASDSLTNDTKVKVNEDLIIQMAESFAKSVCQDSDITAKNPIKFYDEQGQAIGYIVDYYDSNEPYGYIIFDSTISSLISEYSFNEDSKNPYEIIKEETSDFRSMAENDMIYKLSPFTYGIIDNTGNLKTNYGEILNASSLLLKETRGKDPTTWNEVFLEISKIYEDYTLVSTNHLNQFISFNEPFIEDQTGHYACAVSALLASSAYYGALDYRDISGEYMDIWNATDTFVTSVNNNITYGAKPVENIGSGFVNYCSDRNVTVTQTTNYAPGYSFFTNCIDGGNMAGIHCGIIRSDTGRESGHSMAVEGYSTLRAKKSGNMVQTLMVFDGWGDSVRYLNYDFDSWTYRIGTAYNG